MKYSKALNHIILAAAFAKDNQPVKSAKALADAMQQDDFEQTLEDLNDQQEQLSEDQGDDQSLEQFDDTEQQQFAKALARFSETAGDDQDSEDLDFGTDEDEQEQDMQQASLADRKRRAEKNRRALARSR